ncbi:hypothetical protein N7466_000572 [Penicillium verhagenii]|uniref:uncharacterized protein n=1 Tax=Penicillium verhagenii TaxID=1562060 RepID=UPI0025454B1C|nr:uncharacterized protein N7466_000572 [Penicillium verhagenii]KAJ5947557.1 hypothetical protein N7466_000572 [Penicillium verhagenii]
MMGATGLNGAGVATAIARQRLTALPRSSRLMSTFRTQRVRLPGAPGQLTSGLAGNASRWAAPALAGPAAIRFNSTATDSIAIPVETPGELPKIEDLSAIDIASIPEHIGYLKLLGLDYGWGPSSMMQWTLEHIHMWTDMPWWASIIGCGILIRLALLKPMLDASNQGAKLHNLKHLLNPVRAKMMKAATEKNNVEVQRYRAEAKQIQIDNGINIYKSFIPMLQAPLGFGMFRVLRGMTELPVPALLNEQVLWLNDLTMSDPYLILPIISSYCLYRTLKKGGEAGMTELMNGPAGKGLIRGLPILTLAFTAFMPSALQLYFAATGIWAYGQAQIVNNLKFRAWMKMETPQQFGSDTELQNDSLSQLTRRIQEENQKRLREARAEFQEMKVDPSKMSAIDRWMKDGKDWLKELQQQVSKGAKDMSGSGRPDTNADGSPAAPPRLTDAQLKRATKEEEEQLAYDKEERERRNEERRLAYKQTQENERDRVKRSMEKQQQAAQRK